MEGSKSTIIILASFVALFFGLLTKAYSSDELTRLQKAYPDCIHEVNKKYISWKDGSRMPVRGSFYLVDRVYALWHKLDYSKGSISRDDVINDSYEPFFRKMYGHSSTEVKKKLVTIYWMPKVFGNKYPLRVTSVNGVDKKLQRISAELEKLPATYHKYLEKPAGGFYWRNVARESYLSAHSFGIAIDINPNYSNYWLWDLQKTKQPISKLTYRNRIPMKIVEIFEKEGFIWGGRWYFYDTMHFEYRPELFVA